MALLSVRWGPGAAKGGAWGFAWCSSGPSCFPELSCLVLLPKLPAPTPALAIRWHHCLVPAWGIPSHCTGGGLTALARLGGGGSLTSVPTRGSEDPPGVESEAPVKSEKGEPGPASRAGVF